MYMYISKSERNRKERKFVNFKILERNLLLKLALRNFLNYRMDMINTVAMSICLNKHKCVYYKMIIISLQITRFDHCIIII